MGSAPSGAKIETTSATVVAVALVNEAFTVTELFGLTEVGAAVAVVVKLGDAVGEGVFLFAFAFTFAFGLAPPWSPPVVTVAGDVVAEGAAAIGADTANVATSCELSCVVQPGAKARSVTVYVPSAALVGTCHIAGYERVSPAVKLSAANHLWYASEAPPGV